MVLQEAIARLDKLDKIKEMSSDDHRIKASLQDYLTAARDHRQKMRRDTSKTTAAQFKAWFDAHPAKE